MAAKAYRLLRSVLMTAVTSERPTRSAAKRLCGPGARTAGPTTTMTGATEP